MLDACMALHQMLIATTGISVIVGDNSISRYISLANLMLEDKSKLPKYMEYSIKIESKLDNIEKSIQTNRVFCKNIRSVNSGCFSALC